MDKRTLKQLGDTARDLDCGFFACPGPDGNRIYHMRTCRACATVILVRRLLKQEDLHDRDGRKHDTDL